MMNSKQLKAFEAQNSTFLREVVEVRDVVLHTGVVLPNRTLKWFVYDLPTGTVKIKSHIQHTGWANTCQSYYELVAA